MIKDIVVMRSTTILIVLNSLCVATSIVSDNTTPQDSQAFLKNRTLESTEWTQTTNASNETQRIISRNMSDVLDHLLLGYDKTVRPGYRGAPMVVQVDLNIRSMGPISEKEMMFSMDCYFRQTWEDTRLQFTPLGDIKILAFSNAMINKIWRPDTYFTNGKGSYLHTITSPNRLLRIKSDGRVLYSSRLTVKASCPMYLKNYPMDSQACPLKIGSFGYSDQDVILEWKYGNSDSIISSPEVTLSQFELTGMNAWAKTKEFHNRGNHSILVAEFQFTRRMGYFLIQMYIPSILLVLISWVGFFINREATSDRIALGIMTVLTMAFLSIDNRTDLPKVSYATALDVFVSICFGFVMASILEFASVHFFTKINSGEYFDVFLTGDEEPENPKFYIGSHRLIANGKLSPSASSANGRIVQSKLEEDKIDNGESVKTRFLMFCSRFCLCLKGISPREYSYTYKKDHANSVSRIDRCARIIFPLMFAVFNTFYWKVYLAMD